jgi:hypothetical protein
MKKPRIGSLCFLVANLGTDSFEQALGGANAFRLAELSALVLDADAGALQRNPRK